MESIDLFLHNREKQGLLRGLVPAVNRNEGFIYFKERRFIDFSSNDYLNLSGHPRLKEASIKAAEAFGVSASASRLLSGNLDIYHYLEEKTAEFKGKESALIFNSGYQANLGIISALCQKGDAIFYDKLSHASIIDGVILSGVKSFRFRHNDLNHLEYLLEANSRKFRNCLIITETVFGMDGDIAPLKELVNLKEKYNCLIMVDEAHATGIFGENGAGITEQEGVSERVDLIMGTFSKAIGSFGAYLACSQKIRQYLINACRSFIYSTALPPPVIAASIAGLEVIKDEPCRRQVLLERASWLRSVLKEKGFEVRGTSQIIPVITGDNSRTNDISARLKEKGYWVLPIRPPTVPCGQARLRFSLAFNHTETMLKEFINNLNAV